MPKQALPDPELKPDVPSYAEKLNIQAHIRILEEPIFLNALGNPDRNGPRRVVGVEIRCPVCKWISMIVAPGQEGICPKCELHYKYTAVRGNTWLWIWRPPKAFSIGEIVKRELSHRPAEKGTSSAPAIFLPGNTSKRPT